MIRWVTFINDWILLRMMVVVVVITTYSDSASITTATTMTTTTMTTTTGTSCCMVAAYTGTTMTILPIRTIPKKKKLWSTLSSSSSSSSLPMITVNDQEKQSDAKTMAAMNIININNNNNNNNNATTTTTATTNNNNNVIALVEIVNGTSHPRHNRRRNSHPTGSQRSSVVVGVWSIGDHVSIRLVHTSSPQQPQYTNGIIRQIQNGWYTIEVIPPSSSTTTTTTNHTTTGQNNNNTNTWMKCRASQLHRIIEVNDYSANYGPSITTTTPTTTHNNNNHSNFARPTNVVPVVEKEESTTTTTKMILDLDELLLQQRQQQRNQKQSLNDKNNPTTTMESTTTNQKWDMEQLEYFQQSISQWIVFSDLHCSVSTIDTCVEILEHIHTLAQYQQQHHNINTGILFLGDFWHVRSHSIRIDLLNRILSLFQQQQQQQQRFTQPMIFIPGNHDQLSLSSSCSTNGQSPLHSLTAFQNAYRIPINNNNDNNSGTSNSSINGVLIFDRPIKFMNALFIPHVRDPIDMEHILYEMYGNSCPNMDDDDARSVPNATTTTATAADVIFCHVDVTGASMNDNIVSQGGISIQAFPPNVPIYSGHFHKPHNVTSTSSTLQYKSTKSHSNKLSSNENDDTITTNMIQPQSYINEEIRRVEYIGSPYQVSLSESQQSKGILLLNSTNHWECLERIPIQFGRQHYRPQTLEDFLSLRVAASTATDDNNTHNAANTNTSTNDVLVKIKAGDRVVYSVHKHVIDQIRASSTMINNHTTTTNVLDEHIALLRNSGIIVEIREIHGNQLKEGRPIDRNEAEPEPTTNLDRVDMSPSNLWATFISQQVQRGVISPVHKEVMLTKGQEIIDEIGNSGMDTTKMAISGSLQNTNGSVTGNFQLHSVSLRGFGPFRDKVSYPLLNRGLILLRGSNKDGGSDSNGSGKTSLAMSILWAFTGSVDPRPLQDSKVVDVINDASKSATVTVDGAINGNKFSITRTKTSNKGSLSFILDNVELTRQSTKDTQDMINEKLGISPQVLARTIFNGQHALNELLEASDTKLKDELSLVVPLSIWQEALLQSRKKLRDASKRISELDGMISVRSVDATKLKGKFEEAESICCTESQNYDECRLLLQGEIDAVSSSSLFSNTEEDYSTLDLSSLEDSVLQAARMIFDIEQQLDHSYKQREIELKGWDEVVASKKSQVMILDKELQSLDLECNGAKLADALSKERIAHLQEMWKLDLSAGIPDPFVLPQTCPTCQQLISTATESDGHAHLESDVFHEIEDSLARLSAARSRLCHIQDAVNIANSARLKIVTNMTDIQATVDEIYKKWDETIEHIEVRLQEARALHQLASVSFTKTATKLSEHSKVASLKMKIEASKELMNQATQRVDLARREWNDCEGLVVELNLERSNYTEMTRIFADLCDAFGTRGIQTFIMQGAVSMLEMSAQTYLDELSDGAQRLELTFDSGDCIARKAYVRGENGIYKERALASLSGGQWRRCSLAFTLAFADLVANRANFRPSLIVLDEPLMHLDQSGRSNVGRLLRKLLRRDSEQYDDVTVAGGRFVSTILIILQDLAAEELEESFDAIDEVVKDNGVSTVYIDN